MTRDRDRIRLFVGIRVSLDTVARLAAASKQLRREAEASGSNVKWVAPASYHITVKFLGWTRAAAVEAIRDALERALRGAAGFDLVTRGMGAFPSPSRARVVWAGVEEGSGRLAGLVEAVEAALEELGFAREKRPFHAHVTLGRLREVGDLGTLLVPFAEQNFSETSVDSVVLFESEMKPGGSEYLPVAEWRLEPGSRRLERHTEQVEPFSTDQREAGDSGEDGDGHDQGNP